ncbi:FAD-dependent monooxygenase [Streptomyces sp. NPDC006207]
MVFRARGRRPRRRARPPPRIRGSLGRGADPDYIAASPEASRNLSLLRLEPLLKAHAEGYAEATVRFGHELVGLEQDADGVTSTILNRSSGDTYTVRSSYVLGADAGQTVGELAGAKVTMHDRFHKWVSLYLAMDVSEYLPSDDSIITFVFNPEYPEYLGHGAALIPQGPNTGAVIRRSGCWRCPGPTWASRSLGRCCSGRAKRSGSRTSTRRSSG